MIKPVRITLIFGCLSAASVVPLLMYPTVIWLAPLKIHIVMNLALYGALLCLWSKTPVVSTVLPILLVTGVGVWPGAGSWFIVISLIVFCWIRSGICFNERPTRAVLAEAATIIGGAGYLLFWQPGSAYALPVVIWFFFLVQSLYFFIILDGTIDSRKMDIDRFEQASREIERILKTNKARL